MSEHGGDQFPICPSRGSCKSLKLLEGSLDHAAERPGRPESLLNLRPFLPKDKALPRVGMNEYSFPAIEKRPRESRKNLVPCTDGARGAEGPARVCCADSTSESNAVITISNSEGRPATLPSTHSQRLPHYSFHAFGGLPMPSNSIAKVQRSPIRDENATFSLIVLLLEPDCRFRGAPAVHRACDRR